MNSIISKKSHRTSVEDQVPEVGEEVRHAISLVRQGDHRFYTLTMPSNVLAACCFATSKDEDPIGGFQRVLDEKRAQQIADYIDNGGTIPSPVVLSAQKATNFRSVDRSKTAAFKFGPHAFLILDGQHRVFGFAKARTALRVPVVVYDNLSKEQEAQLFIDINTKQRPVPKELLLAIKGLAKTESDVEATLSQIFDMFHDTPSSALFGWTSSTKKATQKIDRVTFSAGFRGHLDMFEGKDVSFVYATFNAYLSSVVAGLRDKGVESAIARKTTFRAFLDIFPDVVQRVQDRFKSKYSADNFYAVISPIFDLTSSGFVSGKFTIQELSSEMKKRLRSGLTI